MARPTDYNADIAAEICARIALGESLRRICAEETMPCQRSVYIWLGKYPEFMQQYALAREDQAETHADEMLEIADDVTEEPNSRRIRIDTRKWIASKLKPKKYGDKNVTEHTGAVTVDVSWKPAENAPAS